MRTVLVLYGLMQHPLRSTVEDHLYSLRIQWSCANHLRHLRLARLRLVRWKKRAWTVHVFVGDVHAIPVKRGSELA